MTILSALRPCLPALVMLAALSGCSKSSVVKGSISASVNATCGGTPNLTGDRVFGYRETSGNYANYLFVGGFHEGDTKELGITMKWPPTTGTFSMGGLQDVGMYYDPTNASTGANQYGATGLSGSVTINSVTLSGDDVSEIDITFTNVEVINGAGDRLCISGSIRI